jgi:glutamyl-tRNA synthetase
MDNPGKNPAVRVRFAPSPTGSLHIGNARTALFNYLFARKSAGKLVLRLEDTDLERSSAVYEKEILESLKWLGISWDEGPDTGGPAGPYRQTEREKTYRELAETFVEKGLAYHCYCTEESLEERRKAQLSKGLPPGYDGRCRTLTPEEQAGFEDRGVPFTIRFKVPAGETIAFKDTIHGDIRFMSDSITDFILVRSNGMASYNWAVAVDDSAMNITHVIRGDDHISNTPKQILLYRALERTPPHYAHHPLILGVDGKRLSKRHGATAVSQFRSEGYLPQAIVFYLVGLGGIVASDGPLLSMEEVVSAFNLTGISKGASIFDHKKLLWINGRFIRELPLEALYRHLLPFLGAWRITDAFSEEKNRAIMACGRDNAQLLTDFKSVFDIFLLTPDAGKVFEGEPEKEPLRNILEIFAESCKEVEILDEQGYIRAAKAAMKRSNQRGKRFFMALRRALTGMTHGPELTKIIPILGKEEVIFRLNHALEQI